MEQWFSVAEMIGLPVVMLLGMSYCRVQMFEWMANDAVYQAPEQINELSQRWLARIKAALAAKESQDAGS